MLTTDQKIELFKVIYHPGKEISKTLDEVKKVVEFLIDVGGKSDDIKPQPSTKGK